ncbi:CPBP family intramembrane glutamate endopeptidase, partial [Staphylococcus saprophyticus]
MVVPIIVVFGTLGLTAMITQKPPAQFLYNLSLSIGFVLAQFLVLFIFFAMHKFDIAQVMKRQFHFGRNKTLHILLMIIGVMIVMCI